MRWLAAFILLSVVVVGSYSLFTRSSKATDEPATVVLQNQTGNKILLITIEGTARLAGVDVPSGYAVDATLDTQGQMVGGWQNLRQLPPGMLEALRSEANSPSHYQINGSSTEEMAKLGQFIASHSQPPQSGPVVSYPPVGLFGQQSSEDESIISRPPVSAPLDLEMASGSSLPESTPPFAVSSSSEGN